MITPDYSNKEISRLRARFQNQYYISTPFTDEGLRAIVEYRTKFSFREHIDGTFYQPRKIQHYLTIGKHYMKYLEGKVLDVGSRHNTIQELLKKDCQLVDKNNPALASFDWEKETLPYPDGSFDAVVCMDTLEHINDLHVAFRDLLRVSREYVIVSLPNCWKRVPRLLLAGGGGRASYGIPPVRPHDRHKWFFNPEDMEEFIAYESVSAPTPFDIVDVIFHIPQTRWWHPVTRILSRILPDRYYKNLFTETTFMVLRKRDVA